jgi:hypothetical protein
MTKSTNTFADISFTSSANTFSDISFNSGTNSFADKSFTDSSNSFADESYTDSSLKFAKLSMNYSTNGWSGDNMTGDYFAQYGDYEGNYFGQGSFGGIRHFNK